jgi:ferredoxin-NADP reductase
MFVRTIGAFLSDAFQRRNAVLQLSVTENKQAIELSAKLRRTYVDLSMSRRQTVWRSVMVFKIVQESDDVRSFYLADSSHEPLPASQAGQHLLLKRTLGHDDPALFRCYSLSDDCTEGYWRISVKKNSDQPQSVSRWLHEEVEVGDLLDVRGPSGAFYLRSEPARCVVLVSAGIGVTPMIPMLIETLRRKTAAIRFFAQFRDVEHMPFAETLLNIANQHPRIDMNLWISRFPKGVRSKEGRFFFEGKFQAAELLRRPDAATNSDFYICGPEEWQSRMQQELVAGGVSADCIDYELFQQAEKPAATSHGNAPSSHNVHFKQSGASAKFEPAHPNLLGCASKNKISLESGCRTGACGSCAIRLLQGKIRYTRDPQFQLKSNEILPCVCIPESDLVLDA